MSQKKKSNRYKEIEKVNKIKGAATRHLNFGVGIFFAIFAYLIIVMITFAIKDKVNYTIAEMGVLDHSSIYSGLVIRDEEVVLSPDTGDVRYFFTEGARVRNSNVIAKIIKDKSMVNTLDEQIFKLNQSLRSDDPIFDESYDYLQGRIKNYVINQQNHKFEVSYSIKREIRNDIDNIRSTVINQKTSEGLLASTEISTLENAMNEQIVDVKAPRSGLVSFDIDGLEHIRYDNFDLSMLEKEPEVSEKNRTTTSVHDPVFKVVDNYLWYIASEIDDECEKQIENASYIGIEVLGKDIAIDVKVDKIWDNGNKTYLMLMVDRRLEDFLNERFIEFRIVYDKYSGIKIPETAVTTKAFAKIPLHYVVYDGGQYTVYKKIYSKDSVGNHTTDKVAIKQLIKEEDYYLIALSEELKVGDRINYTDPVTYVSEEYVIAETDDVEGVYVVNKGYATFKLIETKYREQDYRIVEPYVDYGVRMYDRIATEGDLTTEFQILY